MLRLFHFLTLSAEIFEDNFNGTIPDDKFNADKYISHIIKQTNGDDPTGAWKNFAEADFFTEKELKDGTFKSMIPGLIDVRTLIISWYYLGLNFLNSLNFRCVVRLLSKIQCS